YPTELLKKRERSGSAFLNTATVSCASFTSLVTSIVSAAAARLRRPKTSRSPRPNVLATICRSFLAGCLRCLAERSGYEFRHPQDAPSGRELLPQPMPR